MPIKWQPFGGAPDMFRQPVLPDGLDSDDWGWVPFMPASRSDEPAIDIYQDKQNLYIEVALGAGIKPENLEISVKDNFLVIQGKIEEKQELKEKDYLRREIKRGSFKRVIKLPVQVKKDKAFAESHAGILKITIPKADKGTSGAKKVPIKIK